MGYIGRQQQVKVDTQYVVMIVIQLAYVGVYVNSTAYTTN